MSQTQRQDVHSGPGQTAQLPLSMRQELAVARRYGPRFLFRGFSQSSGGGHSALNTTNGVTPHAFLDDSKQRPPASIETFSSFDLNQALKHHLQTSVTATEFSSWAFTVKMPMYFAKHSNGKLIDSGKKAYLSVIDLHNLDRPVHAYHVPKLRKVFEVAPSGTWLGEGGQYPRKIMEGFKWSAKSYEYKHEYLIHGKVQDPGYHVLELDLDTSSKHNMSGTNPQ